MKATAEYARQLQNTSYKGDLNYFVGVCQNQQKAFGLLASTLDEDAARIRKLEEQNAELLRRNQHLTDRVLRYALGKPQEIPPEPQEM